MVGDRIGPAAALQIGEDAVAPLLVERLKMLAESGLVIHLSPFPRPLAFAKATQLLAERNGYLLGTPLAQVLVRLA
jgi:hypothetical protein